MLRHSLAIQQVLQPLLGPGQAPVVGICLDKSAGLYASILATLGCGAVYLPLEPGHPLPRQQAMLENAGAVVLLDDGQHPLRRHFMAVDVSRIDSQHVAGREKVELLFEVNRLSISYGPCNGIA